jgi:hypothetical protein
MKITKCFLFFSFLLASFWGQAQTDSAEIIFTPNPFTCDAVIEFELPSNDTVTLVVFNTVGAEVASFFDDSPLPSGSYMINLFGDPLLNGIYYLRFSTTGNTITEVIVKNGHCEATSISEPTTPEKGISLYPNPTRDLLTIPIDGKKIIMVTNLQGKVVRNIETDQNTISLSGLASGHYSVSIFNTNRRLLSSSLIVFIE